MKLGGRLLPTASRRAARVGFRRGPHPDPCRVVREAQFKGGVTEWLKASKISCASTSMPSTIRSLISSRVSGKAFLYMEAQLVIAIPTLDLFASSESSNCLPCDRNTFPGRCDAHQHTLVSAQSRDASGHVDAARCIAIDSGGTQDLGFSSGGGRAPAAAHSLVRLTSLAQVLRAILTFRVHGCT